MEEYFSIELDCAPGPVRPGNLIGKVIEGTGITLDPEKPVSMFFGNWEWRILPEQAELYKQHRETIESRIKKLYEQGYIRYGSW